MTHVRIFYVNDMRSSYDPEPLARSLVFDGDVDIDGDDSTITNVVFDRFNRHDAPDQHPALDEHELRSLSVGDVVQIVQEGNSRFYKCARFGWDPIEGVREVTPS